jgi:hypothetical protein
MCLGEGDERHSVTEQEYRPVHAGGIAYHLLYKVNISLTPIHHLLPVDIACSTHPYNGGHRESGCEHHDVVGALNMHKSVYNFSAF